MINLDESLKACSIAEALDMFSKNPDAILVNGGTDVIVKLRDGGLHTSKLISIREIDELKGVDLDEKGDIHIGAGTSFREIEENEIIKNYIPLLSEAVSLVGSPQIRTVGTIGGNICNGSVVADSVPALYCLNAVLKIITLKGEELVPIRGFHLSPGKTLISGRCAILKEIIIKRSEYEGFGFGFQKAGQRNALEISSLNCACTIKLDEELRVKELRITYGVSGPVPIRCVKLEASAVGMNENELKKHIADNALSELSPMEYFDVSMTLRVQLIKTLGIRSAEEAINCFKTMV